MDHGEKDETQEKPEAKRHLYCLLYTQSTVHCSLRNLCIINSNFIDSGATMNGVSPRFCSENGLWDQVVDHNEPMEITLVAKQTMTPYTNDFLVIDVPEEQDLLLGMPWLKAVNPDIDWVNERVGPRVPPLQETGGDYFTHRFYSATSGTTKFITAKQFRRMLRKPHGIECIFVIRPKTEKERQGIGSC
ncbi:hypothetical protein PHYSODRAFT_511777 [Phytophthora sojae]|uniref:Uncharacterized protein n=1 Tax=Phytophthora sojae (strain P6497) TaxID=1094619 RepID=G4ZTM1_PHYSP|nr:hypothetical protein PHYSODRAFT_511777 [Phytophthora sojae]EGZ12932.1 hypothetical protein PHYSODRAFT_511777 [Phytophthora sojae]|eukprot:XP_009530361.1 hypothetical protein PHYSODRAFT_511777 [Phytophthora sojae]